MLKKIWGWVRTSFSLAEEDSARLAARVVNGVIVDLDERRRVLKDRLNKRMAEEGINPFICLENDEFGIGYNKE